MEVIWTQYHFVAFLWHCRTGVQWPCGRQALASWQTVPYTATKPFWYGKGNPMPALVCRGKNKGARGNGQWGGAWMGMRGALYCNGHEAAVCCCCSAEGPCTRSPLKVFKSSAAAFGTTRYLWELDCSTCRNLVRTHMPLCYFVTPSLCHSVTLRQKEGHRLLT